MISSEVVRWAIDLRRRQLVRDEDERMGLAHCPECGRALSTADTEADGTEGCHRCYNRRHGRIKRRRQRELADA